MGKIKKLTETELVGGTSTNDVYPVTSTKAVYDEDNNRLDNILSTLQKVSDTSLATKDKTVVGAINEVNKLINNGYLFMGVATPSTNPGTPDQKVFYIASQAGTYSNFDGVSISIGDIKILYYDSAWHSSGLDDIHIPDGIYTALNNSYNNIAVYQKKITIKKEGFSLWVGNKYVNIQGDFEYEFTPSSVTGAIRVYLCLDTTKVDFAQTDSDYNWNSDPELLVVLSDVTPANKYLILASAYGSTIQPKGYLFESLSFEISNYFLYYSKVRNSKVEVDNNKIYLSFENISVFGRAIKNTWSLSQVSTVFGIDLVQSPLGKNSILIEDENALVYDWISQSFKIVDYLQVDFHCITILGNNGGQYWSALDSIMQNSISDNSEYIEELRARSVNTKKDTLWRCNLSSGQKPYTISSVGNVASEIIAVDGKAGDVISWRYFDSVDAVGTTILLYQLDSNGEYVDDFTAFADGKRTITSAKDYSYILVSANAPTLSFNPLLSINGKIIWTSFYADYIQDARISAVEEKGEQISLLYNHFLDTTYLLTDLNYKSGYMSNNDDENKLIYLPNAELSYTELPISPDKIIVFYNVNFTPSPASAATYFKILAVDADDNVVYNSQLGTPNNGEIIFFLDTLPDSAVTLYLDFPIAAHPEISIRYVDSNGFENLSTDIITLNDKTKTLNLFKNITRELKGSLTQTQKQCVFLHFSDMHQSKENLSRVMQYATYYSDYIDDVIFSGDSVSNSFNQVSDADYVSYWDGSNAQNALFCIGNHDTAKYDSSTGYSWTEYVGKEAYDRYIKPYISSWGVTQPSGAETNGYCYYYKDYAEQKLRVVVLDVMDIVKEPTAQKAWFVETLASAKDANLSVMCICHYPVSGNGIDSTFNCLSPKYEAYSPTLSNDFVNAVKDFIDNGGDFVCYLSGDTHRDFFGTAKLDDRQASVVVSTSSGYSGQQQFDNIERVPETKSQDLFNVIGVDTYHGWFTIFRVGADTDSSLRHIGTLCYDYRNKKLLYND